MRTDTPAAVEHLEDRRLFAVTLAESEPNNSRATAGALTRLPLEEIEVSGALATLGDRDWYSITLERGDVFGAALTGEGELDAQMQLVDAAGDVVMGVDDTHHAGDRSLPPESPLPHTGGSDLDPELYTVITKPGTYYLEVAASEEPETPGGRTGGYLLKVVVARPGMEDEPLGTHQVLFLDFDGATVDYGNWGDAPSAGRVTLSPMASFLKGWGLKPKDEAALVRGVAGRVEEILSLDVRARGLNGDFDATGTPGEFDLEVRNSLDHPDTFGRDRFVSRVVVGGTAAQAGFAGQIIGFAQTVDVGNFKGDDEAILTLDWLTAGLNAGFVTAAPPLTRIDLLAWGMAVYVAHEAGHVFGCIHTELSFDDPFAGVANIMDQGLGHLLGPDNTLGTADDPDAHLGTDSYDPDESLWGVNDTLNTVSFGLSTGKATGPPASLSGSGSSPAGQRVIHPTGAFMSSHSQPLEPRRLFASASLETFQFDDLPTVGTTLAGQEIALGGFSSLVYEGKAKNGKLWFIANTDRGPSGDTPAGLRAFLLPDYAPRLVRFELNPATAELAVTRQIELKTRTGEPLSGLPNLVIPGASPDAPHNDELPHDLRENVLPFDRMGGDFEGLAVDPRDGSYWLVDEYRVSIYHFHKNGRLKERLVPEGTAAAAGLPAGTFGTEALPAVFAQRRPNRGFEGVAVQDGKVYAFMQSPLRNPETLTNGQLNNLRNVRVLELDPKTLATRQFLYVLDNPNLGGGANNRADKVGDVTAIGGGEFLLMERDTDKLATDPVATIEKKVFRFGLAGATDITGLPESFTVVRGGNAAQVSLDQMTPAELAAAGVQPIIKSLHVDLNAVGYNRVSNPEGLASIDANTIAVINDNDFSVPAITIDPATGLFTRVEEPDAVLLGIVRLE